MVAFGSGPTDYDGSSSQSGYMFVVDLLTGKPFQYNDGSVITMTGCLPPVRTTR
jgi:hypothetical protein